MTGDLSSEGSGDVDENDVDVDGDEDVSDGSEKSDLGGIGDVLGDENGEKESIEISPSSDEVLPVDVLLVIRNADDFSMSPTPSVSSTPSTKSLLTF